MLTLYTGNVKRQHKCFNLKKKIIGSDLQERQRYNYH